MKYVYSQRNVKAGTTVFASPLSISLSFAFLKLFLYSYIVRRPRFTPNPCFILSPESVFLYLVHILYPVRSPQSIFYTDRNNIQPIDATNNSLKHNIPGTDSSNLQGNFLARVLICSFGIN